MRCLFLLIPLFLISPLGTAQKSFTDQFNYLATYRYTFQSDSTDTNSKKSEVMFLYLGKESSKFSSAGTAVREQLLKSGKKAERNSADFNRIQAATPNTSIYYTIYKHYPSSAMSFTESLALEDFRYSEELGQLVWEIGMEQKEINGYQAQKATTKFAGRDYVAWFTPEIPAPDGPYKFNGLPGLILEIRDLKEHHVFELVQFEALEPPVEMEFRSKSYILTGKEKFLRAKEDYMKDPLKAVEQAGITFEMDAVTRAMMNRDHREELKKRNNPLELK